MLPESAKAFPAIMEAMPPTRRAFLQASCAAALAPAQSATPWYRRALRWGQTNITEKDPIRYDIPFWRAFWKRTDVQAVIVNAGGIVAYYPSRFPLHHRAQFLDGRDLFGELVTAAHADGVYVMARMDSNRAAEDFYKAHPDWFARDRKGEPYRAADKYVACINSPYYDEYLPGVMREIVERSRPDGFTDNSWAGLGRDSICYCDHCARRFRAQTGLALPERADWHDKTYRRWILWSYRRRTEIWEINNRTTTAAGGPDCIWSGMMSGSVTGLARSFRDLREVGRRAGILMLDHQRRDDDTGFQQNGDTGKRVHGVLGWDKLAPESMSMYQSHPGYYRVASKPAPEARMWMISGIAGGIQPWWHYIGALQEDRRMYRTPEPVTRWHRQHERYLVDRTPVASVGILWSQRNTDFYGRDEAADLVDAPYSGFMHALVRARIPYLPVHADDLAAGRGLSLLVLPNVGGLSDGQCAAIRTFVDGGGSLLATGASTLYDEWGDARPDYALADLFGAHRSAPPAKSRGPAHTYLRLGGAPRHGVLQGFEDTDILPYGGTLFDVRLDSGATVPLTYVPPFPTYPPETAWMRERSSTIPALVLRERGKSRIAWMPADIDRRYAREHLPDHGDLLANIVRWAAGDTIPLAVNGPGMIDCHLYGQPGRLILHLVNLTSTATWRAPVEEFIPVGPIRVGLRGVKPAGDARLLVSGAARPVAVRQGFAELEIPSILDHEVVVLEGKA
jgi:hypothetical protein